MRLSAKSDEPPRPGDADFEIPKEVQLWLSQGWTITPSERKGVVLTGEKRLRVRDKVLLVLGVIGLVFFAVGFPLLGVSGLILVALAGLDYGLNTKPPTKFFPVEGDKPRTLER